MNPPPHCCYNNYVHSNPPPTAFETGTNTINSSKTGPIPKLTPPIPKKKPHTLVGNIYLDIDVVYI